MKSYLFDTNALVYWAYPTAPHHGEVAALLLRALTENDGVYGLASSLNDVYYVLRRHYASEEDARTSILNIAQTIDLVDLTGALVFQAMASSEPDYEDGLIRAAAESLQVDALITYDKKAFRTSFIPAMTATQVLQNHYR